MLDRCKLDLQATSMEEHAYIFILRKRFARIKQRERAGKWNSRSDILNNVNRDFDVVRRRSGIDKCTLHDLRRSAITNWAQHLPIQVVEEFAGHALGARTLLLTNKTVKC